MTGAAASGATRPQVRPPAEAGKSCGPTEGAGQAPWPTFGGNALRSGVGRSEIGVSSTAAAGPLHKQWATPSLDGAVYGEPLVAGGCLFVATENNSVYAFSAVTGALRWYTHLAAPVTAGLPCGDISPSGITGTPVLDPAAGSLWVVVLTNGAGGPQHQLVELKAANGQVERRQGIAMPGRSPAAEQERGALALAHGNVYVPMGGLFGDCSNYAGGVVSVPEASSHAPGYWEVPTARGAGMWEPGGPDVLANGDLLIADGNGAASPGQKFDGSDAVIELSPALKMTAYFAPSQWAQWDVEDLDLGSSGPAVLPGGMAFQVGKSGTGYLLSTGHPGGVGGQLASLQVCNGAGAFGADAVSGETVYVPCTSGLTAVGVTGESLRVLWHSSGGGEGSPVVAGGKVWEEATSGTVYGISTSTGAIAETIGFPAPATHFPWVIAVGSTLYAPDGQSVVALGRI
jgi:polyvinyl alcohol dehydrogenase (cytochrome)